MTRWLSEERPNSLIARSQVRISTVHHRVRAALCLLIQLHCWADGSKFKPATICFQEPGTSASASLIQRSPWRRGHDNDKSGIALTSVKVQAGSEVVYRDTKGYHHLKNRQESVWRVYRYDETIEICYFAKRLKKLRQMNLRQRNYKYPI